jgi:NADH dehydrogenase
MRDVNPRVVIVGAGFGGLQAAKKLAELPVHVTLIDRNNHHTFQPFLYQVALTVLSPAQIATPLRLIFRKQENVDVILGEVATIDLQNRHVIAANIELTYDYLIVAAGARHSYFGRTDWEEHAPGLKTIEDALEIRRRILLALELAERKAIASRHSPKTDSDSSSLNFVVIGGGPTGVEMAGTLASLAHELKSDFRGIDPRLVRVILATASDRVLPSYKEDLSRSAEAQLRGLGVEVRTSSRVNDVGPQSVRIGDDVIPSAVTVWATGVAASPLAKQLSDQLDSLGRVPVKPDLSLPEHRTVFVIGDMAAAVGRDGRVLPGLASVAEQQGAAVTKNIARDIWNLRREPFRYRDWGSMATIGERAAVVQWGRLHISRTMAWLIWAAVHAALLLDFRSRGSVLREWVWSVATRKTSAGLITGPHDLLEHSQAPDNGGRSCASGNAPKSKGEYNPPRVERGRTGKSTIALTAKSGAD